MPAVEPVNDKSGICPRLEVVTLVNFVSTKKVIPVSNPIQLLRKPDLESVPF
jgi:hypothetical protein